MNFEGFNEIADERSRAARREMTEEQPKKSRIAWRSKLTGATGHGEFIAEGEKVGGETIEEHLKGANERNPDLEHWLESEDEATQAGQKLERVVAETEQINALRSSIKGTSNEEQINNPEVKKGVDEIF